jgi:hypothetical protein
MSKREINVIAEDVTQLIVSNANQLSKDGRLQYYFAGSLASNLLCNAIAVQDFNAETNELENYEIAVPENLRNFLKDHFLRTIKDFNVVAMDASHTFRKPHRVYLNSDSTQDDIHDIRALCPYLPQYNSISAIAMYFWDQVNQYEEPTMPKHVSKITTGKGNSFYVTSPDAQFAYKLVTADLCYSQHNLESGKKHVNDSTLLLAAYSSILSKEKIVKTTSDIYAYKTRTGYQLGTAEAALKRYLPDMIECLQEMDIPNWKEVVKPIEKLLEYVINPRALEEVAIPKDFCITDSEANEARLISIDKTLEGWNDLLRRVYDGEETPESYEKHYAKLKQEISSFVEDLNYFTGKRDNWFNNQYEVSQLEIELASRIARLDELPKTHLEVMNRVVTEENKRGTRWWSGVPANMTFYKVHFEAKTYTNVPYTFIDCTFEEDARIHEGSYIDGCTFAEHACIHTAYSSGEKNTTIINSKLGDNAHIGSSNKRGNGVKVINSILGSNCDLGDNSEYTSTIFGHNCESTHNQKFYVDGIERSVAPMNPHIVGHCEQSLKDANPESVRFILKKNKSECMHHFYKTSEYDPLADPQNDFAGRSDVRFDSEGYIIADHVGAMEVAIVPGQKFKIQGHTVEITENGLLVNGEVPSIDGKPIKITFKERFETGTPSINLRSHEIILGTNVLHFGSKGVTYGLWRQEKPLDVKQLQL